MGLYLKRVTSSTQKQLKETKVINRQEFVTNSLYSIEIYLKIPIGSVNKVSAVCCFVCQFKNVTLNEKTNYNFMLIGNESKLFYLRVTVITTFHFDISE